MEGWTTDKYAEVCLFLIAWPVFFKLPIALHYLEERERWKREGEEERMGIHIYFEHQKPAIRVKRKIKKKTLFPKIDTQSFAGHWPWLFSV